MIHPQAPISTMRSRKGLRSMSESLRSALGAVCAALAIDLSSAGGRFLSALSAFCYLQRLLFRSDSQFIRYSFQLNKLILAPATFLGIFLFTAIPEEFLFRGLIQNCLERIAGRRIVGLIVASVVFGASHLNNGLPIPNYRYFLMATVAGIFYGVAWQRTGNLTASGLTHALVDTAWSVLFR